MPSHLPVQPIDCHARVITPENIAFEYALAGPFLRLPAFAFDVALRIVVYAVVTVGAVILLAMIGWLNALGWLVAFFSLLLYFLFSWFYGILFETYCNGRTPGKMLFRLRVISTDGRPISGVQAGLRNLLRFADMHLMLSLQMFGADYPPAYAIPTLSLGLGAMFLTTRLQRIGDLAAGTMVINERRQTIQTDLQPDDLRTYGLAELIPADYQVGSSLARAVGLYMENRQRISPSRRQEIAANVAQPLLRQFGLLPDTRRPAPERPVRPAFQSQQQRAEGLAACGTSMAVCAGSQTAATPASASETRRPSCPAGRGCRLRHRFGQGSAAVAGQAGSRDFPCQSVGAT